MEEAASVIGETLGNPTEVYGDVLEAVELNLLKQSSSQLMVRPPLPPPEAQQSIGIEQLKAFGKRKRQSYLNYDYNTQITERAMIHSRQASATFTSCKSEIKSERGFQSRLRVQKSSEQKQVLASTNFNHKPQLPRPEEPKVFQNSILPSPSAP